MREKSKISELEFIAILALLMSISAYAIDAMLPALGIIGLEFNLLHSNDAQLIISFLFLGLSVGQVFYGPLSDSIGRRRAIFFGLFVFIVGSVICIYSKSMSFMLLGRALQGFGASGSRIITMALVRDKFSGNAMARIMSFVTAVFIIVPALAPAIGQLILQYSDWRMVFRSQLILGLVAVGWFALRMEETLPVHRRKKFSFKQLFIATKFTINNRNTMLYALASGFIFSAFLGYLNSAQQVYQGYFSLGDRLPLFFGILSVAIGGASILNSQLVLKYGMRRLVSVASLIFTLMSVNYLIWLLFIPQWINLYSFMGTMIIVFFCAGILFGNLSSLALEPMGEIAGSASAVIGTIQSIISVTVGLLIGQMYDGTLLPLIMGFAFMGVATVISLRLTGLKVEEASNS